MEGWLFPHGSAQPALSSSLWLEDSLHSPSSQDTAIVNLKSLDQLFF